MKTLSFVIPVYNEEKRIQKTFKALQGVQIPRGLKLEEVIFVNDGSTDKTESRIKSFTNRHSGKRSASRIRSKKRFWTSLQAEPSVRGQNDKFYVSLISYSQNRGKGYAIKQGMLASKSDYSLFFDADMSTPLSELSKFVPYIQANIDVIIGTRKNGHSTVVKHQPLYRELLGRGFTFLTNFALRTWVTDFTCGFKAFSKKAKNEIFEKTSINGWAYDAEIVYLAQSNGFAIQEVPVVWANDARTKVKLYKAIPQTFYDLLRIRWNHAAKSISIDLNLKAQIAKLKTTVQI